MYLHFFSTSIVFVPNVNKVFGVSVAILNYHEKKMTCCYNILTGYKVFLDIFESYGLMYRDTVISTSTFHIHSCKSVMFGD